MNEKYGVVAISFLVLGACAHGERTPGVPWLLGATMLSAAGMPPERPDFYDAPVRVSETLKFVAITAGADTRAQSRSAGTPIAGARTSINSSAPRA
jgi:hypothetical protein